MPDSAHDGNRGGHDRTRHRLLVEFPEILEAATATGDDDEIDRTDDVTSCGNLRDGGGYFRGGTLPLDPNGIDHHAESRMTAMKHLEKVMDRRSRG